MSTAIALQDVTAFPQKETGTVRHRGIHKSATDSTTDDPFLDTPLDVTTSKLPLDSKSFSPTSVYWVTPHGLCTKNIAILDLTKDMDVQYSGMTDAYKAQVRQTLKDHSFTPAFKCNRKHWLGLKYDILDDQDQHVAEWSHPWSSVGEATLTFPKDSPHCPHNLSMRNRRWGSRSEKFTLNSQPFLWGMDSRWNSTNMTLYKVTGSGEDQKKVVVGKFAQKYWCAFATGGTLVVDEKELSGAVACLTLAVVLKKKRQRAAERRHGGE